jgi:hypothetical protein
MRLGAGAGPGQLELLLTLLVIGHDAPGVGAGRPIQSHTHQTRCPACPSSNETVAAKARQPSSATISAIGISAQLFQLPASRALRNARRRCPVM